ncbi:MAG: glutamate--tRNA ligase [Phycisphaerae bacterium]|nr:glutamate--tRNA ligase [Phycisphaerae bacterium]
MSVSPVRVRFAPSPTGYLHFGGARTALFNWLIARKTAGGKFILRIEDTDRSRHVEDSLPKILSDLRWLGLIWDEGPEAGEDLGPYYQSERLDLYKKYAQQLLDAGRAYYALETPEELAAMREQARKEKGEYRYRRPIPLPTAEQAQQAREAGKAVVVRFMMPNEAVTTTDDILGPVTLAAEELEDFIIQKGDGWPTYHLACVVDDALMGITHVLRGQEHLMNTAKHIALQRALGFETPRYAHLPIIFNMNGSKMSKRDKEKAIKKGETPPEIDVHDFRVAGYLPEALLNFISLLGWSTGDDTEQLTLEETVARFEVGGIGKSNAKFDRDKLLAFNTGWASRVSPERLLEAFKDFLVLNDLPMRSLDDATLGHVLRLCTGFRTFRDVQAKAGALFVPDDAIEYNAKAVKKVLRKKEGQGFAMLEAVLPRLEALTDWTTEQLERCITGLCDEQGRKLGDVAQPIRVAVSGSTVSPAIYDTLVLLGRAGTLNRIRHAITLKEQE